MKRVIVTVVNFRLLTNLAHYLGGPTTQSCTFSFLSLMKLWLAKVSADLACRSE